MVLGLGCAAHVNDAEGLAQLAHLVDETARSCVQMQPSDSLTPPTVVAMEAVRECVGDDGACTASTECSGTVEGRECSAERLITLGAATCIAGMAGLEPGLSGLTAGMTYHHGFRRIVWNVQNVVSRGGDGSSSGQSVSIDAVTGGLLGWFGWAAMP